VLDTPAISQRFSLKEVVSIQSEIGYRSTPASLECFVELGRKSMYPIMYSSDQDILKEMMTVGFIRTLDQSSFELSFPSGTTGMILCGLPDVNPS
jgi:hypothetical protein